MERSYGLPLKWCKKFQIFRLIMSCTKNSYWDLKVMQKNPDFQANQSNLLMGVVMIFVYGKRFRYAPSFNKQTLNTISWWKSKLTWRDNAQPPPWTRQDANLELPSHPYQNFWCCSSMQNPWWFEEQQKESQPILLRPEKSLFYAAKNLKGIFKQ